MGVVTEELRFFIYTTKRQDIESESMCVSDFGSVLKRGNHVLGYNSKWLRVVVLTE